MAKSKLAEANKRIEKKVTCAFEKIEGAVISGYTKIEDAFVDRYLIRDGESVEEAKRRLRSEKEKEVK